MYVDVNITPTKTGRIGIYEGDSIRDLAKNFQKAFQLSNSMLVLLMHQLEQHLVSYKEKHGIVDDNKTTFPKAMTQDIQQTLVNNGGGGSCGGSGNGQDDSNQKSRNYIQHGGNNNKDVVSGF